MPVEVERDVGSCRVKLVPTLAHQLEIRAASQVQVVGQTHYRELRASMTSSEVEVVLERAKARVPAARPRIISDNGPQFLARDFKEFIRPSGMTHVRTSPYYPQSSGKMERWNQTLKVTAIRPKAPGTLVEWKVRSFNRVES